MKRARRRLPAAVVLLVLAGGFAYSLATTAGPTVPVISPLVKVKTVSGNVVRERFIPLGVPTPIDVDQHVLGGLLHPDVDVTVSPVAAEELPDKPIVPLVQVKRSSAAYDRKAPAPPLRIDITIGIQDASNLLANLATITYGYETPDGGLTPTLFRSKLIGPLTGGFVDPFEAVVETPGYSAPLKINATVESGSFEGRFSVSANPLPERIHFIEDPREDGLDFLYDHQGPIPDVKLDATADLISKPDGATRHVDAHVERLPQAFELHSTSVADRTLVSYKSTSELAKPDLEVNYRDTDGDGNVTLDANVKAAGLPSDLTGEFRFLLEDDGSRGSLSGLDFDALGGDEVGELDFLARNWAGNPAPVPEPAFAPDQFVAVATRQTADETSRFRAAGRLLGVRSIHLDRQGDDHQTLDVTGNLGDGSKPLRAIVDLDNRGPGGPSDADERRRLKLDTTVSPLPRTTHINFDPGRNGSATRFVYGPSSPTAAPPIVDIDALTADADATNGCGQAGVTCLKARIDKLPGFIETTLPSDTNPDFFLSHDGTGAEKPDVRAVVDRTTEGDDDDPPSRSFADIDLTGVPNRVRGRLDITRKKVVRAAEFHACDWDFTEAECRAGEPQGELRRVAFTVRDQPSRVGLPPRPDSVPNFVSLLKRDPAFETEGDDHFEVAGRVDEIRHIAFRQRDVDDDGKDDGTIGVEVDAGAPDTPFDVDVDTTGFKEDPEDEEKSLGATSSRIHVHVDELPTRFGACVRSKADSKPPAPSSLPRDELLERCDETAVLGHAEGELATTPLSVVYEAASKTKVDAEVTTTEPDGDDGNRPTTTELIASVDSVPRFLRTDVITPASPDPAKNVAGRKLEFGYSSDDKNPATDDTVGTVAFDLAARRSSSLCEDPRPDRKAVCVAGELKEVPKTVSATFDPDKSKGDITFNASPPEPNHQRLSINPEGVSPLPFRLSSVKPDDDPLVVEARVEKLATQLKGKFQKVNEDAENPAATGSLADRIATCTDTIDNDPVSDDGTDAADPDCEPDLARFSFDACVGVPDDRLESCEGVSRVLFKATNALVGDPVPKVPDGPPGVTQDFSFVQAGDLFRATADISKFKKISFDKLTADDVPTETRKLTAAFGNGDASDKIRAYIDRDTGLKAERVDAVLAQAPQAINVCIRASVDEEDVRPDSSNFCEKAPADQKAIETSLVKPTTNVEKPDITVTTLNISKSGGAEILRGISGGEPAVDILNLADTVQVLAGSDGDVRVKGLRDGELANVADRVSFALQDFDGELGGGFPAEPLPLIPSSGSPANFLTVLKSGDRSQFRGSVPDVERLEMAKRPCDPDDPRYPDAEAEFPPHATPEYLCVRAKAAIGQALALTVRKLDADGEILSVDDARLNPVPNGAAGFSATIAKTPKFSETSKVCESHADGMAAGSCRPPLLSIEAPRSPSQTPQFQARLAKGPLALVEKLGTEAVPLDVLSSQLDYEQPFGDWAQPGARIKIGKGTDVATDESQTALRAAFKLALPKFVDIDPPTVYSCTHLANDVPGFCSNPNVGSSFNLGKEAKDIFLRIVGSDTGHLGRDLDTLGPDGRLALLVHDFDTVKQTIVTGTPPSTDTDHGTTPYDGEHLPPLGPWEAGLELPGHTAAKVFLRDDFSTGPTGKQQKYVQVDGRVNRPLSLALRINEPDEDNKYGSNRAGQTVPTQQFTLRNAPCAGRPACGPYAAESFAKPSFRVRAEQLKSEAGGGAPECKGPDGYVAGIGGALCYVEPSPSQRWMNVDLNMSPPGGDDPAREVDAVADTADSQFHLRGFRNVDDKTVGADITPQAALRLEPFDFTVRTGLGVGFFGEETTYAMQGDLIPRVAGLSNRQLRLSQDATGVRLKSVGGTSKVTTDLKARFATTYKVEALFGAFSTSVTIPTTEEHVGLGFIGCGSSLPNSGLDELSVTNDSAKAFGQLVPPLSQMWNPAARLLSAPDALIGVYTCLGGDLGDGDLVNAQHPAPRWKETGRPIDDTDQEDAPPPGVPGLVPLTPGRKDVTLSGNQMVCGVIAARHLIVSGNLRVGRPGESIPATPTSPGVTCDGTLHVDVEQLTLSGTIDAVGASGNTAGTPGSGVGGGAGHTGKGGASGAGGEGGGTYGDPTEMAKDTGSSGANGTGGAAGGAGGGAVEIVVQDTADITGAVLATGVKGADVGGADCAATGAGGGSGGAIRLIANDVDFGPSGKLVADGGAGGSGGNGGGGGGGGRVRIDTVIKDFPATVTSASRGGPGAAGGTCTPGADVAPDGPEDGDAFAGVELNLAATVTRSDYTTNPWVRDRVDVQIKGIRKTPPAGQHGLNIYVCERHRPTNAPLGFEDPLLDPQLGFGSKSSGGSSLRRTTARGPSANLDDPGPGQPPIGDLCHKFTFSDPPADGETYQKSVSIPPNPGAKLTPGFYGLYAYAENPNNGEIQAAIARRSPVKIGSDQAPPVFNTIARLNGERDPHCVNESFCLDGTTGRMKLSVSDPGPGSGVVFSRCGIGNPPTFNIPCPPGDDVAIPLGGEGFKEVDVLIRDQAGNGARAKLRPVPPATSPGAFGSELLWLVDQTAPAPPVLNLKQTGTAINGWFRTPPTLEITVDDRNPPTSGFKAGGITFFVDESDKRCGQATQAPSTKCTTGDTASKIPAKGTHTFRAFAVDRLGHRSEVQTKCLESATPDSCTMRVDFEPPTSRFFIGPRKPPSGFYTTKPFFAIAVSDGVAGSGVDPTVGDSGIRLKVDGIPDMSDRYDPEDDELNRLGEGRHKVCFFAVDVAENAEAPTCSDHYTVDTTPPTTAIALQPAAPDGHNGFYTGPVTVTPSGGEVVPSGVPAAETSGLDRVEYQLDGGPWTAAAPFTVAAEGRHVVRVRALDKAGNQAMVAERTIAIDRNAPVARIGTYPPAPNPRGYFRQPLQHAVSSTDTRDGSGSDGATYQIDGGPLINYLTPFRVGQGEHSVVAVPRDRAGLLGESVSLNSQIDTRAPLPKIAGPDPVFSGGQATLRYDAADQLTPKVRISVLIFDAAGAAAHRIDVPGPSPNNPYVKAGPGSVVWDGNRSDGGTPPPFNDNYHYRVQVTDQAGNTAISTESAQFRVPRSS